MAYEVDKMYLVSEEELRDLINNSIALQMLMRDGVADWVWYGESYKDIVQEYFPEASEEELSELSFDNCVDIIIKDYCEVER